jgi:Fic family protein
MAHLNLVMIHPFSDGNGRMARCLQSLVLARAGTLAPQFSSIEEYLGDHTHDYYRVLADVGGGSWQPSRDARPWVRFALTAHYRQATTLLRRARELERLWSALEHELEKASLPARLVLALADAANGWRIRNAVYRAHADVSDQVAGRDLVAATAAGLLIAKGERRGRHYVASPTLDRLRDSNREPPVAEDDPFA